MSKTAQKQEKKIIDSEIKKILNPVILLFCTRMVILPSLDSTCKSKDQVLKTKGNTSLSQKSKQRAEARSILLPS